MLETSINYPQSNLTALDVRATDARGAVASEPRTLASEELLQGCQEIFIQHGPVTYRLRQTRTGKLLLYK